MDGYVGEGFHLADQAILDCLADHMALGDRQVRRNLDMYIGAGLGPMPSGTQHVNGARRHRSP